MQIRYAPALQYLDHLTMGIDDLSGACKYCLRYLNLELFAFGFLLCTCFQPEIDILFPPPSLENSYIPVYEHGVFTYRVYLPPKPYPGSRPTSWESFSPPSPQFILDDLSSICKRVRLKSGSRYVGCVGCSSPPFMRLAQHLTALRAWCKQYPPGR